MKIPSVINKSNVDQRSSHSNESDSGAVALIAIAILTTILVIASMVSAFNVIIIIRAVSALKKKVIVCFEQ